MQSACLTHSAFFADNAHISNLRKRTRNILLNHKPEFVGCKEARSYHKLVQLRWVSAKIQSLHDMCSVMFRFCSKERFKYVLFVNKGQDLHQKGHTFVKIWTLTPNQTIPGQLSVIRCHLRFLEVAISRTNLRFPWGRGSRNRDSTIFNITYPSRKQVHEFNRT